jgi:hypothetical protein
VRDHEEQEACRVIHPERFFHIPISYRGIKANATGRVVRGHAEKVVDEVIVIVKFLSTMWA